MTRRKYLRRRDHGLSWLRQEEMKKRDFPPIHPGEILLEEFVKPPGISQ